MFDIVVGYCKYVVDLGGSDVGFYLVDDGSESSFVGDSYIG